MDQGITIEIERKCDEITVVDEVLELDGKDILELGCGRAEITRAIASAGRDRKVLALEVDEIQHRLNLEIADLPNVRFGLGGAEAIPAEDCSVDVAFMFKSLHHVPVEFMDRALSELARVLRPGGYAYISEPVFRGNLNEVLRLFDDESHVRGEAFQALVRVVEAGVFELAREVFFLASRTYRGFEEFEQRVLHATHSDRSLTPEKLQLVRETFEGYANMSGGRFETPVRVDLLRRPSTRRC